MKDMVKIVLINILIVAVVALIVRGMNNPVKENELTLDSFSASYGTGMKIVVTICFMIFAFFFINDLGNVFLGWKLFGTSSGLFTLIIFGIFFFLSVLAFCGVVIWRVGVNNESVKYRNHLGYSKTYKAEDIAYVLRKKNGTLAIYGDKGKIFTIDANVLPGNAYFQLWAKKRGIAIGN